VFVPGAAEIFADPGALTITIPDPPAPPDAGRPGVEYPPPPPPPVFIVPGFKALSLLPAPPPPEPPVPAGTVAPT
jgi:hypothetical protein